MNAKSALAQALLDGLVLNVRNCHKLIGYSNIAREIPRMIEKPFGVTVTRIPQTGKNRYGEPINWFNYKLERSVMNKSGIEKLRSYCDEQQNKRQRPHRPKSQPKQREKPKELIQPTLF